MKTSSVEFISRPPTPSPMNSNYRRFVLLRRIFKPGSGSEGKREIVLNTDVQNSTEENIDAFNQRSTCLKKMFLCRHTENDSKNGTYLSEGRIGMEVTRGRSSPCRGLVLFENINKEKGIEKWCASAFKADLTTSKKNPLRIHYHQIYHPDWTQQSA
ncbi:hypothetical protein TNCV_1849661, partial [Trichonephila clavipes]